MLAVPGDRMGAALESLQPEARALLELSVRQGVPDEQIAGLLRTGAADVRRRRREALRRLAAELEVATGDALNARLARHLAGEPEPAPEPERERERDPQDGEGRRRLWPFAVAALVAGAVVGGILAAGTGEDQDEPPKSLSGRTGEPSRTEARRPSRRPARLAVELTGLPGAGQARGRARLRGDGRGGRLELRVQGLPQSPDPYAVWLYSAIDRSVRLATFRGTSASLDARLPQDPARYRFVDISREPADGNPNHSGASVMRVSTDQLLQSAR